MIVVLFQISARAWPPKIMYHKEAQLVVELSFSHNKLIKLILTSGHNESNGLINDLVGHSELTKLNGLVVHIELINGHVGHIKLIELISFVLDFQQGAASHLNDSCLHRLIVVSVSEGARQVAPTQQATSSTILKLIDALISEGAQFDSNLDQPGDLDSSQLIVDFISVKRASKLIVIYSKIPLHFSKEYGIF